MILADTGPLVALFDPRDPQHDHCAEVLRSIREPLYTTVAVLTEAFHILDPNSEGAERLREFVERKGLRIWFFDPATIERAFELMQTYRDHPMDLADASLVTAAEALGTRRVFTIDRNDFESYRIRRGFRHHLFEIIGGPCSR